MDLLLHAPLGQSACMYGRRGVLHLLLYCTHFVPFSVLFLGQVFFFILCVYMCGCGVVGLLSLSLWIVAGMVVEWQDSSAEGEAQGQDCNCGYADGLGEAIAGQGGSYLPRHPRTP